MTPERRPARLLSVGSILADVRVELPHLPPRGGDVLASGASVSAGGAFNVLAAASRAGLPSVFGGRHGNGPYGARIRAGLAREGIVTLLAPDPEGDSGFCLVMVEPDGERTFVTSPGVESRIGDRKLASLPLLASDAVFVSGYDLAYPGLGHAIADWTATWPTEVLLVVDPGPLAAEIPSGILAVMLARAQVLTMNRREATLLARAREIEAIAEMALGALAEDALLVLRDGPKGCHLFGERFRGAPVHIAAPEVHALDSTGAGDAHTGVLVAALAAGLDPISAATRANAAAAISVTRRGPATAPRRQELDAFLTTWPQGHPTASERTA